MAFSFPEDPSRRFPQSVQNTRDPIAAIAAVFKLVLLLVEVSTSYPYDFEFSTAVKKNLKMINCDLSLLAASHFRAGKVVQCRSPALDGQHFTGHSEVHHPL